jgi:hypothetical protein
LFNCPEKGSGLSDATLIREDENRASNEQICDSPERELIPCLIVFKQADDSPGPAPDSSSVTVKEIHFHRNTSDQGSRQRKEDKLVKVMNGAQMKSADLQAGGAWTGLDRDG